MPLHRRSFIFCALVAAFFMGTRAFAQNTAPASMVVGVIKAANVRGDVKKINVSDRSEVPLRDGDTLAQNNIVLTVGDSSAVLVFANGSTVRVGRESRLEIKEFLMDPLAEDVPNVAAMTREPTRSRTNLRLEFGEVVGNVKTLKREQGSAFSVTTPAGAAGIRGTTFRIVYRPTGNGQAFNYQLSTSEGVVLFESTTTAGNASIDVPLGQEITVVAQVDPATNTLIINAPSAVIPISAPAAADIQMATQVIIETQQQTTFTRVEMQGQGAPPPPPTPPPPTPPTPPVENPPPPAPPSTAPRTTPGG